MTGIRRFLIPALKFAGWLSLAVLTPIAVAAGIGLAIETRHDPWLERGQQLRRELARVDETLRTDKLLRRETSRLMEVVELKRAQRDRFAESRLVLAALGAVPELVALTRVDWSAGTTTLEGVAANARSLEGLLLRLQRDLGGELRLDSVASASIEGRVPRLTQPDAVADRQPRRFRITWQPPGPATHDGRAG